MKNFLKASIFIIIFFIILYFIGKILNPSGTNGEWYESKSILDFYKQDKNTMDILYIGNSGVYTSISPMKIYEQYGITGFDLSTPGQKVWSSYYFIKEGLRFQSPKIIFLDVGEFFSGKSNQKEQDKRKVIDPMQLAKNKIEMINDPNYEFSNYDKITCILPTLRYHSRWSRITEEDFRKLTRKEEETYKGFVLNFNKKCYKGKKIQISNNKIDKKDEDIEINEIPIEVREELNKIIETCNENNCKLVLLKIPEPTNWNEEKHNIVESYADENNLQFLDFNQDDILSIDWKNDTFDSGDHLNTYGAEKISEYLGAYLKTNYNLEDHRSDLKYDKWNEFLKLYNYAKLQSNN
jgi:hypothetical protein